MPRTCLTADEIDKTAQFFSFGTNDLTQMTFGFSRDDAGTFSNDYYKKQINESDPFARVDQEGVGLLMQIALEKDRQASPSIKLVICWDNRIGCPCVH
jgi:pyruvate,orthophosphate dikinase